MNPRTAHARVVTLGAIVALLLVLSVETLTIVQLGTKARAALWVMCVMPLALFLPGLLRGAWKTYLWLCFVLCAYFLAVVDQLFRPARGVADWLALVLVVVSFAAAMLYARWRQRELAAFMEAEDNG
jgi:uncharacterized membrane protein